MIHLVLAARPKKCASVLVAEHDKLRPVHSRLREALCLPFEAGLQLVARFAGAVEDVARFAFILFGVIPALACAFVILGVTFHIPRILATYACRAVVAFCWRHVRQRRFGSKRACAGSCCLVCRLTVWMSGGTFPGSGVVACCACGQRVRVE